MRTCTGSYTELPDSLRKNRQSCATAEVPRNYEDFNPLLNRASEFRFELRAWNDQSVSQKPELSPLFYNF